MREPLPHGVYRLRLMDVSHVENARGQMAMRFQFETVDPPWTGKPFFVTYSLEPAPVPALCDLCDALQVDVMELVRHPLCRDGVMISADITNLVTQHGLIIDRIRRAYHWGG